jgi:flagella basal body P-ring formation protein FlgA
MLRACCLGLLASVSLRADPALRAEVEKQLLGAAAAISCAADVSASGLEAIPKGFQLRTLGPLPAAGSWQSVDVGLIEQPSGRSTAAKVRIRLTEGVWAWAPREPLIAGLKVRPELLEWRLFDPRTLGGEPLRKIYPGRVALRTLLKGRPLLSGDLGPAEALAAGTTVTLVVRLGGLEVDDQGVLLESGSEGCLVRAVRREGGKVLRGKLEGRRLIVED